MKNDKPSSTSIEAGDLLLEQGLITREQLDQVRRRQRRLNVPNHRAIVDLNFASEEDTYRALAQAHQLDYVDPMVCEIRKDLLESVPLKLLFHYHMVPVSADTDSITLAFSEPPRQIELGNLRLLLGRRLNVALASPSSIHAVMRRHFGLGAETIQKLREERGGAEISEEIVYDVQGRERDSAIDATLAAFVDQILQEALRLKATDIHLEPYLDTIRLRYRVDGLLESIPVPADVRHLHAAVVSRLKIMSGLNIAEKRLPHDGRIAMRTMNEEYDLRVSIVPTNYGEAVCLRILGRHSLFLDLNQLGMEPEQERFFTHLTGLPQGMILLTGPTGSGKTTTLYAALAHANDGCRKIITLEDPVEYQLEGIVQMQVRDSIGLSFATGLRAILRHDPDIVLVGEIRDRETAEIAVRAAQTGHLVLATLHTNDSINAVIRLMEMRIEPHLIVSSLVCTVAQRLARRVCRHCAEEDTGVPQSIRQEMAEALKIAPEAVQAWKGRGCVECTGKGHRGRVAVYEICPLTEGLADLVRPGLRATQLGQEARRMGWKSIREMGWRKVQQGLITLSEQERWTKVVDPSLLGTGLSPGNAAGSAALADSSQKRKRVGS